MCEHPYVLYCLGVVLLGLVGGAAWDIGYSCGHERGFQKGEEAMRELVRRFLSR
jgi:hypothetical protein